MTYDLDGNTLSDGTNSYAWDARNRLVSANSGVATFAYDPLGRRTAKTLLSATTGFLYDGPNAVQEQNGTGVTANMLTGGVDERFQRTDSTGSYSYLTDALGSTEALTDSNGNSDVQYSYGPYGSLSVTGSTTNSYDYTGRESDGLGLHYYRARYYNPTTGRFVSEDPTGLAGGINLYAYAGDNPLDFRDPFGLDKQKPTPQACFGGFSMPDGSCVPNAPNNATQNKQLKCAGEALKKNGVALALDAASLGVDAFGPEAQYAKLGIGLGLSTASMINSAAHKNMTGTVLGMASYLKAPTELAATSAGWGWAKWIPGAGVVMDGYSAYHDVSATISDYNACMAHP